MKNAIFASLAALLLVGIAPLAQARAAEPAAPAGQGFVFRAGGDAVIGPEENLGAVVVIDGTAHVKGRVDGLLVVSGHAILEGAQVRDLTVVNGVADLRDGSRIAGNLRLVDSQLQRSGDVSIVGPVSHEAMPRWGAFPFGLLFSLGMSLAVLAAGLVAASLAPRAMHAAGEVLAGELGRTTLSAAVLWLVVPPLAIISLMTIVGIPLGIGALFFVLPALAFLGYLVAGQALGERLLAAARSGAEMRARPLLAVVVGLVLLMVVGAVPIVGGLANLFAAGLGAGAIALTVWRTWRARGHRPGTTVAPPIETGAPSGITSTPAAQH